MNTDTDSSMLRELMDREAIRDCLYRYCRACDRHDEALLRTVYWPEARDYHGPFNGPATEFIDYVMKLTSGLDLLHHSLANILIELEGDKAKVETYFTMYQRWRDEKGTLVDCIIGGRYLDKMEKRNGEWRTADRHLIYDWLRQWPDSHDFSKEFFGFKPVPGTPKPNDLLYTWLDVRR